MRKTRLILIAGVLIAAVATAWGIGGRSAHASVSTENAVAASAASCNGAPVHGGNLVYDRQAATETLDPLNPRNGNGDIFTYNLIYSGLVRSDPTGKSNNLVPGLATSWT